ncbi:hypothetical protein DRJ16_04780 [Candidatus Woesearchaeota archaeon]|nr:MAG: hypothetical protein DRJ16_04780 [Candidatus Woesearchaeota archaeon]
MKDKTIRIHPRRIRSLEELEEILSKLESLGDDYGVALLQNRQFGGSYHLVTRKEYEANKYKNGKIEFYCKFWPRSYFERLREKFLNKNE